jgi:hypothetical protein
MILRAILVLAAVALARAHESHSHRHSNHDGGDDDDSASYVDPSLKHCKYTRESAVKCAQKYADLNGDGLICSAEIEALKAAVLWLPERIWSMLHSASNTMEHCDHDRDGYISEHDFYHSTRTCLATCEGLVDFTERICQRAERDNIRLPEVACE